MKFEELSSDVQARIIDEEAQFLWEAGWYEGTLDLIQEVAEMVGIYVESGFSFDLDRRNFGFTGEIAYKKGWKQDAIKNYGAIMFDEKRKQKDPVADFLQSWEVFCKTTQKRHFYSLRGAVNLGYWHNDARIGDVIWDRPDDDVEMDDLKQDFEEILEDFKHMALRLLENEIEYQTSADRIIDMELEYDEDGNEIDMVA